jgi:hypothetical protein
VLCSCAGLLGIDSPLPLLDAGADAGAVAEGDAAADGPPDALNAPDAADVPDANEGSADAGAGADGADGADTGMADDGPADEAGEAGEAAEAGDGGDAGEAGEGGETGPPVTYTTVPTADPFIDACTLPGSFIVLKSHNDANTSPARLPFPFSFFGETQTLYWVNSNGVLGFTDPSMSVGLPSNMPTIQCPPNAIADPFPAIYAFGDDLFTRMTGVCIATQGAQGNRQFVVTWEDAYLTSDMSTHLTFSAVLTETTNTIDLLFGTMTSGAEAMGSMAAIGIEDSTGTRAATFSCDEATITSTPLDVRFTPSR